MANQVEDESAGEDKKKEILPLLTKNMAKGQTWYLISKEWWRKFQHYVGIEGEDGDFVSKASPGAIDNCPILNEKGDLKAHLLDKRDYELVPSEAWELLVKWFGKVPGQDPLKRKVIEVGENKQSMVEVYPVVVRTCKNWDLENIKALRFSKSDTIGKLKKEISQVFNIPDDVETKLWHSFLPVINTQNERLDKLDKTIQEVGICHGHTVIVETPNAKGIWNTVPFKEQHYGHGGAGDRRPNVQPGICGLCNLGNTCFMNSVLQCMSNCSPITEFFLTGAHHRELNTDNPLGMGGEIAKAYGDLVQNMWSGKFPSIAPHPFKMQVGRFAPQFSGYQQHDSQELLTFLLDGLHEDLNRIKDKPYIEQQDGDGLPDEELAKRSWENYLKRNDSIIVDFFHGLLKSTVVCPDCNKISVTFDPFCYLSLPLPQKKERLVEVVLIHDDPLRKPMRYKVAVPKKGTIRDVCMAVSGLTRIPIEKMFVTQVVRNHFHETYSLSSSLSALDDRDELYIYELPVTYKESEHKVVPVCLWQNDATGPNELFGMPVVVVVPKKKCTYDILYRTIISRLSRYLGNLTIKIYGPEEHRLSNGSFSLFEDISNEMDEYNPSKQNNYLFSIHRLSRTSDVTTELEVNGKPIDFSNFTGDQSLAIQWSRKNRTLYFKESATHEIDQHESVRHKQTSKLLLKDCLELYTTTEKLGVDDAWYCPQCKKHQRATKKFDLWTLPRILIIHLKRFSYSRCRRDKIDTLVEFPFNGLDMREYVINQTTPPPVYDLFAVCNHYGGMGGGHYTAYAKNKLNDKWYCFDDNSVTYTNKEPVVSAAAYVLFYMQRDANDSGPCVNPVINSGPPPSYEGDKFSDEEME